MTVRSDNCSGSSVEPRPIQEGVVDFIRKLGAKSRSCSTAGFAKNGKYFARLKKSISKNRMLRFPSFAIFFSQNMPLVFVLFDFSVNNKFKILIHVHCGFPQLLGLDAKTMYNDSCVDVISSL